MQPADRQPTSLPELREPEFVHFNKYVNNIDYSIVIYQELRWLTNWPKKTPGPNNQISRLHITKNKNLLKTFRKLIPQPHSDYSLLDRTGQVTIFKQNRSQQT